MLINDSVFDQIPKRDLKKFWEIIDLMNDLRAFLVKGEDRPRYRCHSICRAIAAHVSGLQVVDGAFLGLTPTQENVPPGIQMQLRTCAHSWLLTKYKTVIDPYPVGFMSLNAVAYPDKGQYRDYGKSFYLPDPSVSKTAEEKHIRRETRILTKIITKMRASAS